MLNFYKIYNIPEELDRYADFDVLLRKLDRLTLSNTSDLKRISHIIMKKPIWGYWYARYIIKCRWSEAEKYIIKDPQYALCYAFFVMKERWIEAESYIKKDEYWWSRYTKAFEI
jgi:hypothetical protein